MQSRAPTYVILAAWGVLAAGACSSGAGPRLDARPDADAGMETACDASGCAELCRARGHCGSSCEAGDRCVCWGGPCVDASGDVDEDQDEDTNEDGDEDHASPRPSASSHEDEDHGGAATPEPGDGDDHDGGSGPGGGSDD